MCVLTSIAILPLAHFFFFFPVTGCKLLSLAHHRLRYFHARDVMSASLQDLYLEILLPVWWVRRWGLWGGLAIRAEWALMDESLALMAKTLKRLPAPSTSHLEISEVGCLNSEEALHGPCCPHLGLLASRTMRSNIFVTSYAVHDIVL